MRRLARLPHTLAWMPRSFSAGGSLYEAIEGDLSHPHYRALPAPANKWSEDIFKHRYSVNASS